MTTRIIQTIKNNVGGQVGNISFLDLTDVPTSYSGEAGMTLVVNSTETGLELVSASGSGDMTKVVYDPTNINASAFDVDNHISGDNNKVFTTVEQDKLFNLFQYTDGMADIRVSSGIVNKVDKIEGKVLSDNNYTNLEQLKVLGIASGTVISGTSSGINTGDQIADGVTITGLGTLASPFTATTGGAGNVSGPSGSVDSNFVSFNGTSGKLIKDSGNKASDFSTDIHSNITALNNVSGVNTGDNAINTLYSGLVQYTDTMADARVVAGIVGKQDALGFTPENILNKVTTISSGSVNTQYPSAKLVYDQLALKSDKTNVLQLDNTTAFTPDADYEPATKKYVDDAVLTENLWDRVSTTLYPHTLNDNINIGSGIVTLAETDYNNNLANPVHAEGKVFYDRAKHALSYYNEESEVTVNLGQELLIRVKNSTLGIIENGSVVYPSGFDGTDILIDLAIASDKEKCRLIGVVTQDIGIGENGYVTKIGEVGSLDTSTYVSGDVIYLSPTVLGGMTKTKPTNSNYTTRIGVVKHSDVSTGSIVVDIQTSEYTVEALEDTGWSKVNLPTLSFTDGILTTSRYLTITPAIDHFVFYQYGDKYLKLTDSIRIPDTEGLYVIYYNLGTLQYLLNPTEAQIDTVIRNNPMVAELYWNATDKKHEYLGYGLHKIGMASETHAYLHAVLKLRYISGVAPSSISADTSGNLTASAQFGIGSGVLFDEDIIHDTPIIASTVGLLIYYLSGTSASPTLRSITNSGFSVTTTGTGRLAYNTVVDGNYVLSEVNNNDFVCCHVLAVNSNAIDRKIIAVVGQVAYTTVANARAGALTELSGLRTVGIIPQEIKAIATFIFETSDSYSNAVKARVRTISTGVNYVDFRNVQIAGVAGGNSSTTTIFADGQFKIFDDVDSTKLMQFDASTIDTLTTRTLTIPNKNGTIAIAGDYSNVNNTSDLNKPISNAEQAIMNITREPTGFLSPDLVIINYDPTAQTITLTGTCTAYWRGAVVAVITSGWVSTPHTNTTGHTYFLYYNGTSFLWSDNVFPGFSMLLIARVNYGAVYQYAVRECHGFMQWQVHQAEHETIGTYKSSGGTFPSISYTLLSTTATDRRPNVDEALIWDEDCPTTIDALTTKLYNKTFLTGTGTTNYTLGTAEIIPLLANNPYYNSFNTPNWGQTLFPSNSVGTVWVYAVPVTASASSQQYRLLFVQPQWITQASSGSSGSMLTALNAELLRTPAELNLGTLSLEANEFVCIGRIVVRYTTNWSLGNVSNITGNKFSQIGSPAGNFLSLVSANAPITGLGTVDNPLVIAPATSIADGYATSTQIAKLDAITGTNTGDNAVNTLYSGVVSNATHTGEVTGSGALTIASGVVTNSKLANMTTNTIKGRITGTTGSPEDLTATNVRTIINVADGANNYVHPNHSGEVTSSGDGATTIASGAVTLAKMANMATASLIYRRTSNTGVPEVNTLAQLKTDLALQNYSVIVQPVELTADVIVGNGVSAFTIPTHLNGLRITAVHARVLTAGTTNSSTFNIQINGTNVLSTAVSIDTGQISSSNAGTPYVIDTAHDDVTTNDLIELDVLTLSTTAPKGLLFRIEFGV